MDKTHNPEFTMMEIYIAYKDYYWMMDMVEDLFGHICEYALGKRKFTMAIKFSILISLFEEPKCSICF